MRLCIYVEAMIQWIWNVAKAFGELAGCHVAARVMDYFDGHCDRLDKLEGVHVVWKSALPLLHHCFVLPQPALPPG